MTKEYIIFQPDEFSARTIDPKWSKPALLRQDGIFFLKDVLKHLNIDRQVLMRVINRIKEKGDDVYKVAGVQKVFSKWKVRMTVFAPFYRKHLVLSYQKIPDKWDSNDVLNATKGVFLLTDICKKIPFTKFQIQYQAKKLSNSKKEIGVWKDSSCNMYLVKIALFGPWIKKLWQKGFSF